MDCLLPMFPVAQPLDLALSPQIDRHIHQGSLKVSCLWPDSASLIKWNGEALPTMKPKLDRNSFPNHNFTHLVPNERAQSVPRTKARKLPPTSIDFENRAGQRSKDWAVEVKFDVVADERYGAELFAHERLDLPSRVLHRVHLMFTKRVDKPLRATAATSCLARAGGAKTGDPCSRFVLLPKFPVGLPIIKHKIHHDLPYNRNALAPEGCRPVTPFLYCLDSTILEPYVWCGAT